VVDGCLLLVREDTNQGEEVELLVREDTNQVELIGVRCALFVDCFGGFCFNVRRATNIGEREVQAYMRWRWKRENNY
jgi:hypothetical protein